MSKMFMSSFTSMMWIERTFFVSVTAQRIHAYMHIAWIECLYLRVDMIHVKRNRYRPYMHKDNSCVKHKSNSDILKTHWVAWIHIRVRIKTINMWIQYLEFRTKNYYNVNTQIKYDQECITSASEITFLG